MVFQLKSKPPTEEVKMAEDPNLEVKTNSGNSGVLPITPMNVGEPADAASLAIDQKHLEDFLQTDMKPGVVECKRPPKAIFFTVRKEDPKEAWKDRAIYFVLEPAGRDPFLVPPAIAAQKKEEEDTIRPVLLVRYVTMAGEEGLWPLKLNPQDGKSNRWNTSAMDVLRTAENGAWVRLIGLISRGEYRVQVSGKKMTDVPPRFSERTFKELVNAAFPPDRVINSLDHPIWDELANGRVK
jgi:hypothetical protein